MFETETVEPCLVRKLKVDGGGRGVRHGSPAPVPVTAPLLMTSRSQKPKLKLNSRATRALELLKVLQNHQKRNRLFLRKIIKE